MPELRDATVVLGVPGLNGTGLTGPEKTAITNDTTALKAATYITQTANATLSAEQPLSTLATGLVKVTTGTGVLSTATSADLPAHTHTILFSIPFVLDGGGVAITTGTKVNSGILLNCACTYYGWAVDSTTSASMVVTVERSLNASPTAYAGIATSEKPTLTASTNGANVSMASPVTFGLYDRVRLSVDSATSVYATVNLLFSRTI